MNPAMHLQQATEERKRDAVAILLAQSEKKRGQLSKRHWGYASHSEKHVGPFRRTVDHANRATPYVKDSLKFRMARGFGTLPVSESEKVAWAQHRDENFERFLDSLKGAGGQAACSAETFPKLVMARGFARPCVFPVDKLYTHAHQQFDDTLLRHMKFGNNAEVSSMLQGVSNVHQLTDSLGTTLLHFAAMHGNRDLVQHLINLGAAVDARNRHCETPLMYAVEAGEEATIRLLLNCNADILLPGHSYCALGKVLSNRANVNENIVSAILDRLTVESLNASEYVKTNQFHSTCPLYHFISLKNVEITRVLLEKGSLVDAKCQNEETALHLAAKQLDLEHVKLLLEFGANVNARQNNGNTPITSIQNFEEDHDRALAVVQVLVSAGASLIDSSSSVKMMEWPLLMRGNREVVRAALECPIDFQSVNDVGLSPLHYLARNRHVDVFAELRDVIFDVDIRCSIGATLLHHAASAGNLSSLEFLIDRGIDVDARDELGRTPMVWAMRGGAYRENIDDYLNCIEGLLELGASPRFLNAPGALAANFADQLALLAKPVVAYSAMLEASGRPIDESVMEEIESCWAYKTNFELAKFHLEEMDGIRIFKAVTLLDVLIANDRKISMYARNPRLVLNLSNAMKECKRESYLDCKLRTTFGKIGHLAKMRKSVTVVVNEVLSRMYGLNVQNVAQTIVNFVDDQDLYRMLPVSE